VRKFRRPRAAGPTIRTRILVIAWVPSLVLLVVGAVVAGLLARQSAQENSFTTTYARALQGASRFAAADQLERQLTVAYLLDPNRGRRALNDQRAKTDVVLQQIMPLVTAIQNTGSSSFVTDITRAGMSVAALPQLRQGVDTGLLTWQQAADAYSQTLNVFHSAFETLAMSAVTARVGSEYQLSADLFRLTEWRSESDTYNLALYGATGLTDAEYGVYLDRVGGYHSLLATVVPRLPAVQQAQFKTLTSTPAWQQLAMMENTALRSGAVPQATTSIHRAVDQPISRRQWEAASVEVSQKLIDQYLEQATYSTDLANRHARNLFTRSLAAGIGLLLLSLLVFLIVTRMSNRLIRRLRRLRSETLEVAGQRLPMIVERLNKGEQVDLERELPALDHGRDEIGQVADAFNQAQRTAVVAAVKEAEIRAGTSKVFLNIAHRSQIVAHRQLKLLDQAERSQEDPDQLSLLFQLDHLTTRSRRNAENLIILGGGQPGRRWRNPVPLLDVVRSAVGEAETYTGISIERIPEAWLNGAAVADIIHLLAELVDNATSFSPPSARVEVRGNVAGRGIVIEIEDQGLGIEPDQLEELNQMLSTPPDFGVMALSDEPRLGLFVVTQLAIRHGVRVTLTESRSYGGIRAVVLIPVALLTPIESLSPELRSATVSVGANSAGADPRELISARAEWMGGPALPTRRPRRMILNGPPDPPTGETPSAEPTPLPERPRSGRNRVRKEGEWQTAEIPAIQAPVASSSPQPAGPPPTSPPPATAPSVPFAPSARPAAAHEPARSLMDRDQRPPLPHRVKQAHLAPQLFADGRRAADLTSPVEALPSADSARDRMAAFQLGTKRGRQNDPGQNS
jgi:signal transduction histidine kinase